MKSVQFKQAYEISSLNVFIVSVCVCNMEANNIYHWKMWESSEKIYLSAAYKYK